MAQMAAIRNAKRPQQQEDETLSRLDDKQSSTDPAIERRLDKLEMMMADSISRLDRLQHLVELVMELEERFDIQIPDDQTSKILTVGNAVDFIHDQMQAKGTK